MAALRISAGAVTAATLAACGAVGQEAAPKKTAGPVTVTYMSNLPETHPEGEARLSLLDEFGKTNGLQITVNVAEAKGSTNNDKLKTLAAAGTPPDLYYTAYYFVAEFLLTGMTIDVDSELKAEKDWGKQRADIFPPMLESSMWDGKLAGMPGYTNNQGIIYNTGLLQQAGVAPPKQGWTWDDFKATAQKFVRPGLLPLSMAWAGTWRHWLGTTGGHIITKDSKKITADTPEMLLVMELYLDLLKRGIMQARADGRAGLNETYQQAKNDTVFELQGPYRI
ncbi:MAG: extracellular solute-binding protein, partial [Chloroflexi bacterium]|nr:extracellular solute-binding protein [Chloroflexota bacterium]